MDATRKARIESLIQEEIAQLISRELKDPRIPSLTVTSVKVTDDASQATIYVAILGVTLQEDEDSEAHDEQMRAALAGLTSAAGFLRRKIATVLTIRHIPNLIFKEDKGLANSLRVNELLKKIASGEDQES